jgi:hypothetical protein
MEVLMAVSRWSMGELSAHPAASASSHPTQDNSAVEAIFRQIHRKHHLRLLW